MNELWQGIIEILNTSGIPEFLDTLTFPMIISMAFYGFKKIKEFKNGEISAKELAFSLHDRIAKNDEIFKKERETYMAQYNDLKQEFLSAKEEINKLVLTNLELLLNSNINGEDKARIIEKFTTNAKKEVKGTVKNTLNLVEKAVNDDLADNIIEDSKKEVIEKIKKQKNVPNQEEILNDKLKGIINEQRVD